MYSSLFWIAITVDIIILVGAVVQEENVPTHRVASYRLLQRKERSKT